MFPERTKRAEDGAASETVGRLLKTLGKLKHVKKMFLSPTSNRLHSPSFVHALGGFPSSSTAVFSDFVTKLTKNSKNGFEPMYPEHFCVPKTMVDSVSAQTPVLTDVLKKHASFLAEFLGKNYDKTQKL